MAIAPGPTTISPTVQRIVDTVKDRIQSGAYPEGEWLPTERSLAEEFGVSRILIRAAVKELEREQLISCSANRRPLVRRFAPDIDAPPVSRRNIALWIWPQHSWPGSNLLIQGIQEVMGESFRLILGNTGGSWSELPTAEARFLEAVCRDQDIAGIILSYMGGAINIPLLEALRAADIPIVFVDHLPPLGFAADYVGVNNRRSAEQAVKHLISLGHRSIAHLSNFDTISTVAERREGYRRALEMAGIPVRPELITFDPGPSGDDPQEGCEGLVDELLSLPDPPTAIFAVNDVAAFRVMAALRARGLRVPEDMSVVGFDGIERWMPTTPFLTTLHQPFGDIGAQAMELLKDRILDRATSPYKHLILDARLCIHNSTRRRAVKETAPSSLYSHSHTKKTY